MLLPHLDHEKQVAPEGGFAEFQHKICDFVHSECITRFLILCLVLDVILTLGEFMIQHSQCDYQKDHRSFVVKIEFEAADRRGMAMTIPHVPTTYVHASARREEASHESTTETACDSPSCYKLSAASHTGGSVTMSQSANLTSYETATMKVEAEVELEENHTLETLEEIFAHTSFAIIIIFALEIVLLLIGMGSSFFCNFFYVLDFVVVGTTIAFDFIFHEGAEDNILIILRMWRFVRIIHGVYAAEFEDNEMKEKVKEESGGSADVEVGLAATDEKADAMSVGSAQ